MTNKYTWERSARQTYGDDITDELVAKQEAYEKARAGNDCASCGRSNEGAIHAVEGVPILIHFGTWRDNKCLDCGRISKKETIQ